MEILEYQLISNHQTILILYIFYSLLSLLLGFYCYRSFNKDWKFGLFVSFSLVGLMTWAYISEDKSTYEYQKVIVEDWNEVYEQGWEVIKHEGEIVELKRKLEEEK